MDLLVSMRAFVRSVETGSLAAAARDLDVGQPAVSKQVAALEAHLGVSLARRSTRSLRLTDEGRRYYERSKRVLDEVEAARAEAASQRVAIEGVLRVNAPVGFGELVLTDLVLSFQRKHPKLTVELTLLDRPVDLVADGVDLALRIGPIGAPDLVARPLASMPRAFFAAPSYLARRGEPRSLQDLARHDYLRFAWLTSGDRVTAVGPAGPESVRVRGTLLVNNTLAIRRALEAGAGLGAMPLWLVHDLVEAGGLVPVLEAWRPPASRLHALYVASRYTPERVRALVAHLRRGLERRSDNAPLAQARGSKHPVKRRSKPAPRWGRAPFVHARTTREPRPTEGGALLSAPCCFLAKKLEFTAPGLSQGCVIRPAL